MYKPLDMYKQQNIEHKAQSAIMKNKIQQAITYMARINEPCPCTTLHNT